MADQTMPEKYLQVLERIYTPKQARFIFSELGETGMQIIDYTEGMSSGDYLCVAVANKLVRDKMALAEHLSKRYHVNNLGYFNLLQTNWLREKRNLMRMRLHREPQGAELMEDAIERSDPLRFRVFFCLRHRTNPVLIERKVAA